MSFRVKALSNHWIIEDITYPGTVLTIKGQIDNVVYLFQNEFLFKTRKAARLALAGYKENSREYVYVAFDDDDLTILKIFRSESDANKYAKSANRQYEPGYNPVTVYKQEII